MTTQETAHSRRIAPGPHGGAMGCAAEATRNPLQFYTGYGDVVRIRAIPGPRDPLMMTVTARSPITAAANTR